MLLDTVTLTVGKFCSDVKRGSAPALCLAVYKRLANKMVHDFLTIFLAFAEFESFE